MSERRPHDQGDPPASASPPGDDIAGRLHRLEMLDGLLVTLMGVLDIREVFDRVSAIADKVLPHDALSIAESIDNGARVRVHASHGLGHPVRHVD
jgi:hypothetical protein